MGDSRQWPNERTLTVVGRLPDSLAEAAHRTSPRFAESRHRSPHDPTTDNYWGSRDRPRAMRWRKGRNAARWRRPQIQRPEWAAPGELPLGAGMDLHWRLQYEGTCISKTQVVPTSSELVPRLWVAGFELRLFGSNALPKLIMALHVNYP